MSSQLLTTKEVAHRYGIAERTVKELIYKGELAALNLSRNAKSSRPRWRITEAALAEFEAKRTSSGPAPRAARRKKPAAGDVVNFYA